MKLERFRKNKKKRKVTGKVAEEIKNEQTAPESAEETAAAEEAEEKAAENTQEAPAEAEAEDAIEEPIGDEASAEADKEKKGFFKKKKDKKDEQIEELNDKLLRQMAEFNNFRNRSEKEKSQMFDLGSKNVIEKILPVVDNFERGLATVPEEMKEDAFVLGMDKVYKQLITQLEALGVKPIECVGKEFNPEFHNAVMQVATDEYESGIVAQELMKGYTYKDTVVRHSMVAVVQ